MSHVSSISLRESQAEINKRKTIEGWTAQHEACRRELAHSDALLIESLHDRQQLHVVIRMKELECCEQEKRIEFLQLKVQQLETYISKSECENALLAESLNRVHAARRDVEVMCG